MSNAKLELVTALSPEECIARLAAMINIPPNGYDNLWVGSGNASICGEITGDEFFIYIRTKHPVLLQDPVLAHETALTSANATIVSRQKGALIIGRCGIHPQFWLLRLFGAVCALLIITLIVMHLADAFSRGEIHQWRDLRNLSRQSEVPGWTFMMILNIIIEVLRRTSKFETGVLRNFLVKTLEARRP